MELGPGLIESIFDGIQRPLTLIREKVGDRIVRGWRYLLWIGKRNGNLFPGETGDKVETGDIVGIVQETSIVEHRVMVPAGVQGSIEWVHEGPATVVDPIAKVKTDDGTVIDITMMQRTPVRIGRKYREKLPPAFPMMTGQRVIDTFFPVAKGGVAAVPGPLEAVNGGTASAGQVGRC